MTAISRSQRIFLSGSDTEIWICYNDSHEHLRNFELLIASLAHISTELLQFFFLFILLILSSDDIFSDVIHNYLYTHIHNPMIHIYTKYISLLFVLLSRKKVHFSFIKVYRGTILRSCCDVIDDVITMKILFLAQFGTIFPYLMSNWSCIEYLKKNQNDEILGSMRPFSVESVTGNWTL